MDKPKPSRRQRAEDTVANRFKVIARLRQHVQSASKKLQEKVHERDRKRARRSFHSISHLFARRRQRRAAIQHTRAAVFALVDEIQPKPAKPGNGTNGLAAPHHVAPYVAETLLTIVSKGSVSHGEVLEQVLTSVEARANKEKMTLPAKERVVWIAQRLLFLLQSVGIFEPCLQPLDDGVSSAMLRLRPDLNMAYESLQILVRRLAVKLWHESSPVPPKDTAADPPATLSSELVALTSELAASGEGQCIAALNGSSLTQQTSKPSNPFLSWWAELPIVGPRERARQLNTAEQLLSLSNEVPAKSGTSSTQDAPPGSAASLWWTGTAYSGDAAGGSGDVEPKPVDPKALQFPARTPASASQRDVWILGQAAPMGTAPVTPSAPTSHLVSKGLERAGLSSEGDAGHSSKPNKLDYLAAALNSKTMEGNDAAAKDSDMESESSDNPDTKPAMWAWSTHGDLLVPVGWNIRGRIPRDLAVGVVPGYTDVLTQDVARTRDLASVVRGPSADDLSDVDPAAIEAGIQAALARTGEAAPVSRVAQGLETTVIPARSEPLPGPAALQARVQADFAGLEAEFKTICNPPTQEVEWEWMMSQFLPVMTAAQTPQTAEPPRKRPEPSNSDSPLSMSESSAQPSKRLRVEQLSEEAKAHHQAPPPLRIPTTPGSSGKGAGAEGGSSSSMSKWWGRMLTPSPWVAPSDSSNTASPRPWVAHRFISEVYRTSPQVSGRHRVTPRALLRTFQSDLSLRRASTPEPSTSNDSSRLRITTPLRRAESDSLIDINLSAGKMVFGRNVATPRFRQVTNWAASTPQYGAGDGSDAVVRPPSAWDQHEQVVKAFEEQKTRHEQEEKAAAAAEAESPGGAARGGRGGRGNRGGRAPRNRGRSGSSASAAKRNRGRGRSRGASQSDGGKEGGGEGEAAPSQPTVEEVASQIQANHKAARMHVQRVLAQGDGESSDECSDDEYFLAMHKASNLLMKKRLMEAEKRVQRGIIKPRPPPKQRLPLEFLPQKSRGRQSKKAQGQASKQSGMPGSPSPSPSPKQKPTPTRGSTPSKGGTTSRRTSDTPAYLTRNGTRISPRKKSKSPSPMSLRARRRRSGE